MKILLMALVVAGMVGTVIPTPEPVNNNETRYSLN